MTNKTGTGMKHILSILVFFFALASCAQKPPAISRAASSVGDIPFDKTIDDSDFRLCDSSRVFQYYNTGSYYLDHKDSFRRYFFSQFSPVSGIKGQNGYITVKFIINCDGLTGRFRMSEMDSSYQPYHFDQRVSDQVLSLVRALKNWDPAWYKGNTLPSGCGTATS
jgi:hypothetical protein